MNRFFTFIYVVIFSTTSYFVGKIEGERKAFNTTHNKTMDCLDKMMKDVDSINVRGDKLFGSRNRTRNQTQALLAYELDKCMRGKE